MTIWEDALRIEVVLDAVLFIEAHPLHAPVITTLRLDSEDAEKKELLL